jgi:HEAT repeat protein
MRTPEVILAEMDALFPEPPDLSILGNPNVPIEKQKAYMPSVVQARQQGKEREVVRFTQELTEIGEAAIPYLLDFLDHRKPMVRGFAALALGGATMKYVFTNNAIKDDLHSRTVEALLGRLNVEKKNQPKSMVITSLGMLEDERAVEPLLELLHSPIEFFRDRDSEEITPLEKMRNMKFLIEDEHFHCRNSVVTALGNLEDRRIAGHLMQLMDTDLSEELGGLFSHRNAAEILVEWGVREAIEPIQRCLARYQESTLESVQRSNQYVCPHLETALHKLETQAEGIV